MILSFAWTTPAVVIGQKVETRRDWSPKTIALAQRMMQEGRMVEAWDRSPRFGGKQFGSVIITSITESEDSQSIPNEAWIKEGFHVLSPLGAKIGKSSPTDVWHFWLTEPGNFQTVVGFYVHELNDYGEMLADQTRELLRKWTGTHFPPPLRPKI